MKFACEKCNKIMNENKGNEIHKIQLNFFETIVLCDKCFKEFRGWIHEEKEEVAKEHEKINRKG